MDSKTYWIYEAHMSDFDRRTCFTSDVMQYYPIMLNG